MTKKGQDARLLITCQDKHGIVAKVAGFLHANDCNITELDQHSTDPEAGQFFMRLAFHKGAKTPAEDSLKTAFQDLVAAEYNMDWKMHFINEKKRVAILCSKEDHAVLDLLWSHKQFYFEADIPLVISNHENISKSIAPFDIPFHHVASHNKAESEAAILALLKEHDIDYVVLARYMQILTGEFISHYPNNIINIHHSFLPAFVGSNPYKQALDKGVKLIGATAHYITEELDQGPIIDQDTQRITHSHTLGDLKRLGQSIEKTVLTRAVKYHLEDRVILHGNKTVVFGS